MEKNDRFKSVTAIFLFHMTVSFFSMPTSAMCIDLQGLFELTPSQFVIEKMSLLENMPKAMGKNCFVSEVAAKTSLEDTTVVSEYVKSIRTYMIKWSGGGNTLENIQFNLFSLLNKSLSINGSVEQKKKIEGGGLGGQKE